MIRSIVSSLALISSVVSVSAVAQLSTPTVYTGVDSVCGAKIAKRVIKESKKRYAADVVETLSVVDVVNQDKDSSETDFLRIFAVNTSDEVGRTKWMVITDEEDCLIKFVDAWKED